MLRSSSRIRHDTASTARWWMINTSWPVVVTQRALSIAPLAGLSRDRAWASASSESASTACRHSPALTAPASGTVSDQAPVPSSAARSRSMAWRSIKACRTTTTSVWVTSVGACTTIVWLNWSIGPSMLCSQCMIGVGVTGPMPSSTAVSGPSATPATRASRATDCSTKMSRGRQVSPAARARATTCIDKMLSPPRSKKESSMPTRSRPSTWA